MQPGDKDRYQVPILRRALDLIEVMAQEPSSYRLTELANKLGFPKNSVFRILKTLTAGGYAVESDHQYRLSAKFLSVGYANLGEDDLVGKSIDIMRELRVDARETVLLGVINELEGIVLEQVLGTHEVKFSINVGHRFYLHSSAPGKAMLAFLPEAERVRMLDSMDYKKFNSRTVTSREQLLPVLEKVRRDGYAVDCAERIAGLNGAAAPVFNHFKYPVAAIWITGPSFRLPLAELKRLGPIVRTYADRISQRLGYER